MSDLGYTKNVGFIGSLSLLIGSLTGPGIVIIPQIYQESGWLFPTIAIMLIAVLTGLASLFVVESCSRFPGNSEFQRNVEYSVVVHQFYGRFWHTIVIFVLFGSLQSPNVASIVGSAQVFDTILIEIFGVTCGYGIHPISGIYCVRAATDANSPFGDNWMAFTFGLFIIMAIVIPLAMGDLNDNIVLQFASIFYIVVFFITLVGLGSANGYSPARMPIVGKDHSHVIGTILFNFVVANSIPSWINIKHKKVSVHKAVWFAVTVSAILFILIGIFGGLTFNVSSKINLLQAMKIASADKSGPNGWMAVIYAVFPVMTYLGSIVAAMIVIRLNFLAAGLCSRGTAQLWAIALPFAASIPLQTGPYLDDFSSWSSVIFQSTCNFFVPFLMYLFLSKRRLVIQQSVMDELEFLDLNAGIRKMMDDDDDFDYIYHLPYADTSKIKYHDPFAKIEKMVQKKDGYAKSVMSGVDNASKRRMRGLLNPGAGGPSNAPSTWRQSGNSVAQLNGSQMMLNGSGGAKGLAGSGAAGNMAYLGSKVAQLTAQQQLGTLGGNRGGGRSIVALQPSLSSMQENDASESLAAVPMGQRMRRLSLGVGGPFPPKPPLPQTQVINMDGSRSISISTDIDDSASSGKRSEVSRAESGPIEMRRRSISRIATREESQLGAGRENSERGPGMRRLSALPGLGIDRGDSTASARRFSFIAGGKIYPEDYDAFDAEDDMARLFESPESFFALPEWLRKRVRPQYIALVGLMIMVGLVAQVIIATVS